MRNKSEITLIVILLLIVVFGAVGWRTTPKDEKGQPVLLLPDVKRVEDYRKKAGKWTDELKLLDGKLAVLMSGNTNSLFSQSKSSQDLFADFVKIAQEVENTESPASLTGLKDALLNTIYAYLNAGQSALKWVSNPSSENFETTQELIVTAQDFLSELEKNTWIKTTN